MRRSTTARVLATLAVLGALAAGTAAASAAALEPVTLPGTGDSQDLLRALARSYSAQYPDRQVIVPDSIGSDGGVRVVGTGESPIGRVARRPTAQEIARYGELQYVEFARVNVAFVVNPAAGVRDLSRQQVCDIFSGRVTSWKEVGGHDLPIDVQARPDGSNLQAIRAHIPCFAELHVTPRAHFNLRNADLVASMKAFPGAIGFMPLGEALLHGYQTVSLDGVPPDAPDYRCGIGLGFVHRGGLPPGVQAFLDHLQTEEARSIIRRTGHAPVAR